ncbi:MAG: hypothetical protein AAGD07_09300 [Planctomycetota bacterium]
MNNHGHLITGICSFAGLLNHSTETQMNRILPTLLLLFFATVAQAHFPWMVVDKEGNVEYFFGEGMTDRTYKLPAGVAGAEIAMCDGSATKPVETETVETDDFVGKRSVSTVPTTADLISQVTFGVYHGAKLQYYTQHLGGKMPAAFSDCTPFEKMDLQAHAVDTEGGVDVYVLWQGKPLVDAEVRLFCDEGHEEGNATTGEDGKVSFNDKEVEDGINAIMVGHTVTGETGKVGDQEYSSAMHYLTATFYDPED